ncbi:MAG: MmcQ/YjbR family DNA-binding protein [Verrucomicrobia bacterium]|nr:MmcQ/YjbR family DNA-binding protein [Verrucomicrobiota bacterium]
MDDESDKLINRLRDVCLAFPAVVEKEAWGECTFRARGGKMFAMTDCNHHNSGHVAVWVMAPPKVQEGLARSGPDRFFKPPYVGAKGWVGVVLDARTKWDELGAILRDGYLMSAPVRTQQLKPRVASPTANSRRRVEARITQTTSRSR